MCGCSNFVEDEGLNFTGNRPSVIEVGEDPSFDFLQDIEKDSSFEYFTGNRPSVVEVGEDPSFDFLQDVEKDSSFDEFIGKKARARRQERRAVRRGDVPTTTQGEAGATTRAGAGAEDMDKNSYGTSSWFSNNWIYIVLGVAVVGGGYYFYKKRK
jgi:LPXTG-motif cell wall-anchored protein